MEWWSTGGPGHPPGPGHVGLLRTEARTYLADGRAGLNFDLRCGGWREVTVFVGQPGSILHPFHASIQSSNPIPYQSSIHPPPSWTNPPPGPPPPPPSYLPSIPPSSIHSTTSNLQSKPTQVVVIIIIHLCAWLISLAFAPSRQNASEAGQRRQEPAAEPRF
jgi:hypothetical protein